MSKIMHFEIPAKNPTGLKKFYSNVFGWEFNKWNGPNDYWMINTGNEKVRGIDGGMEPQGGRIKGVVNVINVKDLDETMELIFLCKTIIFIYMLLFQKRYRNIGVFMNEINIS